MTITRRKSSVGYKNQFGRFCMLCGRPGNETHHIIPLSRGGRDIQENKIILCSDCHNNKQIHSNPPNQILNLLTHKFYAEAIRLFIEEKEACTLLTDDSGRDINDLSMVQEGDIEPQKGSEVLLQRVPVENALSMEEQRSIRRPSRPRRKIPPHGPETFGKEEEKLEVLGPPAPGEFFCACGKHFFVPKRPDQKWESTKCRDDTRNAARWESSKKALLLADEIIGLLRPNGSK